MRDPDEVMVIMDLKVEVAMVEEVEEEVEVKEDLNIRMKILKKLIQQEKDPIYV